MNDALHMRLPPTAAAAHQARGFVRDALHTWGMDAMRDAALLLTSELVTNSVLHARTDVELTIRRTGDVVRIAVADGSTLPPSRRRRSRTATTGRGMQLLESLADSWQTDVTARGKTVWFTLSLNSDPWVGYHDTDWTQREEG